MNNTRKLLHSLLFAVILFVVVAVIVYLFKTDLWYAKVALVCFSMAIGFFFGYSDGYNDKPYHVVADENELEKVDDGLDE